MILFLNNDIGKPSSKVDSLYALLSMCQIEIEKSLEEEHSNISGLNITEIDELLGGTLPLPNFLNTKKQEWNEDPKLFLTSWYIITKFLIFIEI